MFRHAVCIIIIKLIITIIVIAVATATAACSYVQPTLFMHLVEYCAVFAIVLALELAALSQ